jgi:acetyl-CoA synthetase
MAVSIPAPCDKKEEMKPVEISPEVPWPGYRAFPEQLNLAEEVLRPEFMRERGQRTALIGENGPVTYDVLQQRVDAVAAGLIELGLQKSDRVLIAMMNRAEFALVFLAAVKLAIIPVLVNSALSPNELTSVATSVAPRLIITESALSSAAREMRHRHLVGDIVCVGDPAPDEVPFDTLLKNLGTTIKYAKTAANEPAFIVYTSGTTGKPKGIVHAHRWIVALGDLNRFRLPPQINDVVMATGEWSFISALGHNLLFPLRNGITGAVLAGRGTAENLLRQIEKYRVTVLYSVATVYRRLLAMPGFEKTHDLKSLRCAHSTGEALREATYREWRRRVGAELYEHYGVSEYQLVIGHGVRHSVKAGSVGKPLSGVAVDILDDEFKPVPSGELGQFAISTRDPGLFLGYYQDDERTQAVVRNGWYFTGDLAYQDAEGYFYIAGRRDDCFKSRGIFISPTEVENALQKHPAIIEAAVVPNPDAEIGNKIRAVIVLADGYEGSELLAEQIREAMRREIAPFKIPQEIQFAQSLPKSAIGKILRSELILPLPTRL